MPFITSAVSYNTITVPTDALDNLLYNEVGDLTLAKMDIEGAEILALKGAQPRSSNNNVLLSGFWKLTAL